MHLLRKRDMSATDYVVDILLIVIILRHVRPSPLTARSALLPVVIIVWAGLHYLHSFKLGGNDLLLMVVLVVVGITLGLLSGITTRMWRDSKGLVFARVGAIAILTWVLGMGFRFAFAVYANSASGNAEIGRFSARHDITSSRAWTTALVLMAFGEVLARVAILQARRIRTGEPALT